MKDRFKELSTQCMKELTEVFERMDDSNVRELLEEIKKTPRIFLLAAGREGLATKSFAMRLMHLGKESFWIWDDTTPSIGEGDLMICACGSANVGHEKYVAKVCYEIGNRHAPLFWGDQENTFITIYNEPMMVMLEKIHGVKAEKKTVKLDFDRRISAAVHNHHH